MRDEDIEASLRRYRVVDPPAALHQRIHAFAETRGASGHVWGVLTAAALLVIWLGAHAVAEEPMSDPARLAEIALVADVLGGGEDARRYAEAVVSVRRPSMDRPSLETTW
jgi:hypothetical protein